MSELNRSDAEQAIERITEWLSDYGDSKPRIFIGDVSMLLLLAKERVGYGQTARPESEAERVLREWGEHLATGGAIRSIPMHETMIAAIRLASKLAGETTTKGE